MVREVHLSRSESRWAINQVRLKVLQGQVFSDIFSTHISYLLYASCEQTEPGFRFINWHKSDDSIIYVKVTYNVRLQSS
ncbi:hypothetical protein YC2023_045143 [Brassica napus]